VTIPEDTAISLSLETAVASNTSRIEDPVRGRLTKPIVVSGRTVAPVGADVIGTVVDVKDSGRVKGRASIALAFERLIVRGETYRIRSTRVTRQAEASTKSDLKKGGLGAAAGAIIGGIAGGGKGAAIGAGVGATGAVLATKGEDVKLVAGTIVTVRLQAPVAVIVPRER
jgi:hypothetical protein